MIRPIECAATVNAFANHPDIRPSFGGTDELDLSVAVTEPNVFLFGDHGGFCFSWCAPDTFEAHVMITKAGRGRWGATEGRRAIELMAARGARHLWCRVHPERPEAGVFAAACGMKDTGQTNDLDIGDGVVRWRLFSWSN